LPAWFIPTTQVAPIFVEFIVYVAPALVHAPALVNVIGNPELALATTVKLLLLVAVAGAGTLTVIVWLA
jgi:hypothetical protein